MTDRSQASMTGHRFHVLLALAGSDLHGSGIVRDVLSQTGGALHIWPATLYGALDELESEGMIRELGDADRPGGVSQRRRYYRITSTGRAALRRETRRLAAVVGTAQERLGRS